MTEAVRLYLEPYSNLDMRDLRRFHLHMWGGFGAFCVGSCLEWSGCSFLICRSFQVLVDYSVLLSFPKFNLGCSNYRMYPQAHQTPDITPILQNDMTCFIVQRTSASRHFLSQANCSISMLLSAAHFSTIKACLPPQK